jgi:hypothetical protein
MLVDLKCTLVIFLYLHGVCLDRCSACGISFREPENSLPCSQYSATRPYPLPVESCPHPHYYVFNINIIFVLFSVSILFSDLHHICLCLPCGLFLSLFPVKLFYALRHATCPAHCILDLIILIILMKLLIMQSSP